MRPGDLFVDEAEIRVAAEDGAGSGARGAGARKTGRDGEDAVPVLPAGTLLRDLDAPPEAPPLADPDRDGARVVVARGGRGNARHGSARSTGMQGTHPC